MGKLIFTIDQHPELINFGTLVLKRMLPLAKRNSQDKSKLLYPGLITLFLKKHGIVPEQGDEVRNIKPHAPGSSVKEMHNDFKDGPPPTDEILAQEIRDSLVAHTQKLTEIATSALAEKRKISILIAKFPRSLPRSDYQPEAASSDTESL